MVKIPKGVPADWLNWGGKRPGAGRPKKSEERVKINPYVKKITKAALDKLAFTENESVGTIIDNLVDKKAKKK